ncbi:MAG TPA: alpha/beta hydrolase [Actinocrinis sp.]|nr:alpha/beta hydrolase [Actinocrinis sp.]
MDEASEQPTFVRNGKRKLAVQWWGDPNGSPVFLMHGTPGSRLGPRPRGIVLERMGVKLISYDRPGYGQSSRELGRLVANAAADVECIADELGIKKFSVVGRSGGGPHALACAAQLKGRVERVAVLVSPAPPDALGLDWDEGMGSLNAEDFADIDQTIADTHAGAEPLNAVLHKRVKQIQDDPDSLLRFLEPDLRAADKRVVGDWAMRKLLTATYAEAVRTGSGGWIDDTIALRSPWGFDLDRVTCPVFLWHGGQDRFSPPSHTQWMAERLTATRVDPDDEEVLVRIDNGLAHFAAFEVFPEVLAWVVDPAAAGSLSLIRTIAGRAPGGSDSPRATQSHLGARARSGSRVAR